MQKLYIVALFFVLNSVLLFLNSCNKSKTYSSEIVLPTKSFSKVSEENVIDVTAVVLYSNKSSWLIKERLLNKTEDLKKLGFIDNNGWVISETGNLWMTSNSGKVWHNKVKIQEIAEGASVSDTNFINSTTGFVTGYIASESINDKNDISFILKTNDGGEKWKKIYTEKDILLRKVKFVNENEGWAIGRKSTYDSQYRRKHFVIHTVNGGKTWIDVSEGLNELSIDERGNVNDELTAIYSMENDEPVFLSLRGKTFQTIDGGKSWRLISILPAEPMQTCICHLGQFETGKIWVAGGTISREGQWGMIAVKQSNDSWLRVRLGNFYFADIKFLSNKEVIAIGSTYNESLKNNNKQKGVILVSKDVGKNWEILYQGKTVDRFNSIASVSSNKLIVVGDNGSLVYLEKSEN